MKALIAGVFAAGLLAATTVPADAIYISVGGGHHWHGGNGWHGGGRGWHGGWNRGGWHRGGWGGHRCRGWGWHHGRRWCRGWW